MKPLAVRALKKSWSRADWSIFTVGLSSVRGVENFAHEIMRLIESRRWRDIFDALAETLEFVYMKILKTTYKRGLMAIALVTAVSAGLAYIHFANKRQLLIAPMIGGLHPCTFLHKEMAKSNPDFQYAKLCAKDEGSPSQLIKNTLDRISDRWFELGDFKLGYTLNVPLLRLFEVKGEEIVLNQEILKRVVSTIANVDRPVVLYLFSDHFGVDSPVENQLAKDPANLLQTRKSVMQKDRYYSHDIFPWSFVDTGNGITKLRETAFNAVLDEVCKLPWYVRRRIEGVTMLGELHHMFPNFESGMGYSGEYLISDYSQHSVDGFRKFLAAKYQSVADLNSHLNWNYNSFEEVFPPSKNIRTERLNHYLEHIDSFANGTLPISGWIGRARTGSEKKDWIQIYDNGEFAGRVPVAFGRQDVLAVHPELGTADVGWEFKWEFSNKPRGIHKISVYLERGAQPLTLLSTREIALMERSQAVPVILPLKPLPMSVPVDPSVLFVIDHPVPLSAYYYNPLVPLWHDFRKSQVTHYLDHFSKIARSKCIKPELIYSHQILPFVNPGWDENKFSVGPDLGVPSTLRLGVSLYGESSYGTSFFEWFAGSKRDAYGVTEFHPLRAMDAPTLKGVLDHHFQKNAQFLSFFTDSVGLDENSKGSLNIFSITPQNQNAGSNVLYESVREILK